jgi:hypothetical protein
VWSTNVTRVSFSFSLVIKPLFLRPFDPGVRVIGSGFVSPQVRIHREVYMRDPKKDVLSILFAAGRAVGFGGCELVYPPKQKQITLRPRALTLLTGQN